jgi:1L-myo-inositol 1-phosphate cytidylyltransferase
MTSEAKITDAVILMAGLGSRLRLRGEEMPKPLIQIAGRAVFSYTLDALERAGIKTIHAVTGYNSGGLVAGLKPLVPATMIVNRIFNPEWEKQNGISVLAARSQLARPFLLMMGDHLFGPLIVERAIEHADLNMLNVAVDRKVNTIFDLADAMKVQTKADRVTAIGKNLETYDAIDTGLFVCPTEFFDYLERAKRGGDCSLADGVRSMANDGKVRAIDVGDAWWQDIDTPEMLMKARSVIDEG